MPLPNANLFSHKDSNKFVQQRTMLLTDVEFIPQASYLAAPASIKVKVTCEVLCPCPPFVVYNKLTLLRATELEILKIHFPHDLYKR